MSLLRGCCFNWKVWAGAGAVLLLVLLLAPNALGAVFPIALALACPLSMAAMMWGMRSSRTSASASGSRGDTEARIAALQAEIAHLQSASSGSDDQDQPRPPSTYTWSPISAPGAPLQGAER